MEENSDIMWDSVEYMNSQPLGDRVTPSSMHTIQDDKEGTRLMAYAASKLCEDEIKLEDETGLHDHFNEADAMREDVPNVMSLKAWDPNQTGSTNVTSLKTWEPNQTGSTDKVNSNLVRRTLGVDSCDAEEDPTSCTDYESTENAMPGTMEEVYHKYAHIGDVGTAQDDIHIKQEPDDGGDIFHEHMCETGEQQDKFVNIKTELTSIPSHIDTNIKSDKDNIDHGVFIRTAAIQENGSHYPSYANGEASSEVGVIKTEGICNGNLSHSMYVTDTETKDQSDHEGSVSVENLALTSLVRSEKATKSNQNDVNQKSCGTLSKVVVNSEEVDMETVADTVADASQPAVVDTDVDITNSDESYYVCPVCNMSVGRRKISKHIMTHSDDQSNTCPLCKKSFIKAGVLVEHMRIHTGVKPFACTICDKRFARSSTLKQHVLTHTGERLHGCPVCRKTFTLRNTLMRHLRVHSGEKPHVCSECDRSFITLTQLKHHMMSHTGETPYLCSLCAQTFTKRCLLKYHMMQHSGSTELSCTVCDKSFTNAQGLKRHALTHTGERPHQCTQCGSLFALNKSLRQHMLTHTGEKAYPCLMCDKRFIDSSQLKRHMFTHTGEKPHSCTVCDKKFGDTSSLRRHLLVHSGEKPHICSFCGKNFSRISNLHRHQLVHTGERPHECAHCGKRFTQSNNLKQHILIHTGQKDHVCMVCGKDFTQAGHLKLHLQSHISSKDSVPAVPELNE